MLRKSTLLVVYCLAAAVIVPSAHGQLVYSGTVDVVLGGFPETPLTDFFIDPLMADFAVASTSASPAGNSGGVTYLTSSTFSLVGDGTGNIANFQPGEVVDTISAPSPVPDVIDQLGGTALALTGYDFGNPAGSVGQYFNQTTPEDYYWAFNFVPDGTIGLVSGWMKVTVNPVEVNSIDETLSGGELIVREFAWYATGQEPVVVGSIPEPTSIALVWVSLLGAATRRALGKGPA